MGRAFRLSLDVDSGTDRAFGISMYYEPVLNYCTNPYANLVQMSRRQNGPHGTTVERIPL
jgi:hypothetical protein